MKTYKIGGVAAALTLLLFGSIAQADHLCMEEAQFIEDAAKKLVCAYAPIEYTMVGAQWSRDAIWQFKGKSDDNDGCVVHFKIAKQLYVPHDQPPLGRGKGKGNNEAQGAANALRDNKFEDALLHLQNVIDTIDYSAKLNTEFTPVPVKDANGDIIDYREADWYESRVRELAVQMKLKIFNPTTGTGCSVQ